MGRPQVLAPLGPVETGPWRFGGVLGQGGRRASTKAFARFTSEWDHAAELLDEADRLLSLSGDADVRREARMFVAGDWDWERIFKGTTDSATAAEESADERANSALRRLRLLLSHVNAELLRADSSKKTGPTGPEPGAMEELRKHAMEGELMDYGRLQRDLARWSGAEALHDGDIDRRGTPDSFDSANFV